MRYLYNFLVSLEETLFRRSEITWNLAGVSDVGELSEETGIQIKNYEKSPRMHLTSFSYIIVKDLASRITDIEDFIVSRKAIRTNEDLIHTFLILSLIDGTRTETGSIATNFLGTLPTCTVALFFKRVIAALSSLIISAEVSFDKADFVNNVIRSRNQYQLYMRFFEPPVNALGPLLKYGGLEALVYLLDSAPLAIFFIVQETGYLGEVFWKFCREIDLDQEVNSQAAFKVSAYLYNLPDFDLQRLDEDWLREQIGTNWTSLGIVALNRSFPLRPFPPQTEETNKIRDMIADVLSGWIQARQFDFVEDFLWPRDYFAFSGFLYSNRNDNDSTVPIPDQIDRAISRNLFFNNTLDLFSPKALAAYADPFGVSNSANLQQGIALRLVSFSIVKYLPLHRQWRRLVRRWLMETKVLFYSSYRSVAFAVEIVGQILLFVLFPMDFSDFLETEHGFVSEILSDLQDFVLYQYVMACELREEFSLFGSIDQRSTQFGTNRAWVAGQLIRKLQGTTSAGVRELYSAFFAKWKTYSTTVWPWMVTPAQ